MNSTTGISFIKKKLEKLKLQQGLQKTISEFRVKPKIDPKNLKSTIWKQDFQSEKEFVEEKFSDTMFRDSKPLNYIIKKKPSRVQMQSFPMDQQKTTRDSNEKIAELEALLTIKKQRIEHLESELASFREQKINREKEFELQLENQQQQLDRLKENELVLKQIISEKQQEIENLNEMMKLQDFENQQKYKQLMDSQSNEEINDQLFEKNRDLEKQVKNTNETISNLQFENKTLAKQIKELKYQIDCHQLELKKKNTKMEDFEKIIISLNSKVEDQNQQISKISTQNILGKIKQIMPQMYLIRNKTKHSLQCKHCGEIAVKPITVIPCAHIYCQKCKQGYSEGKCKICGPKVFVLYP